MVRFMKFIATLLLLLVIALPVSACFGPKLYLATPAGEDGELLFHLLAIYIHEKTGVESLRQELAPGQTAEGLLKKESVDLAVVPAASAAWPSLLQVGSELFLLSGPRPTDNLQFTTVPRALKKLQNLLKPQDLVLLRQQVAAGVLPAGAVRSFYLQRGWL